MMNENGEMYKMETTLCKDCLHKLEPLLVKVAETYATEGEGKCTLVFQTQDTGNVKALFLPFKEARMVSYLLKPLWKRAVEIGEGVQK